MLLPRWAIKMGVVLINGLGPKFFARALRALAIQPYHSRIPRSALVISKAIGVYESHLGVLLAAEASPSLTHKYNNFTIKRVTSVVCSYIYI